MVDNLTQIHSTPESYIEARDQVIEQEQSPKEGDLKVGEDQHEYCFYNGQWVKCTELPEDHPSFSDLPF